MSSGINQVKNTPRYERLLARDITRLPDKTKASVDFYKLKKPVSKEESKKLFRKKIFTGATFGLVGLWLAHRNNLFNPVHREAKKIIRNEQFQKKIREFVDEHLTPQTFIDSTKRFLNKIVADKDRKPAIVAEAKKALDKKEVFEKLFEKVSKKLNDDDKTLHDGYAVDLLDRLFIKIERDLAKNKEHGLPYKEQGDKVLNSLLSKNSEGKSPLTELLYEAITNRSSSTIEEFVKDAALDTKLNISA